MPVHTIQQRRAGFRLWLSLTATLSSAAVSQWFVSPTVLAQDAVAQDADAPAVIQAAPSAVVAKPAPDSPQLRWLPKIQSAQEKLNAETFPSSKAAREQLDAAISSFENYLDRTPENRDNWKQFLGWSSLKEELAKEQPNQDTLLQLEKRFRQNFNGLELSPFTSVRDAIKNYLIALRFGTDQAKSVEILRNRLAQLADLVQNADLSKDNNARREAALTVSYLDQANQIPELVHEIHGAFSRPNARVLLSADYVHNKFGRGVCEPNPVCEEILGTRIFGNSILSGAVTPRLIPSSSQAMVRLQLNGDFSSNNIGYNRGVKLYTTGSAFVSAGETIALGPNGLMALGDTHTDANLTTNIHAIDAKLKIIEKVAAKVAAKQKPQADAIAEGRMENRIRTQFHDQLVTQLAESNQKIGNPSIVELVRLGLDKPMRTSWSSDHYLAMLWKVQQDVQLAAPSACPHVVPTTGIALQIHESAIVNLLDPVLAGRILNSEESEMYRMQFGELAEGAVRRDNDEPWAITMAGNNPIEVQFEDSKIIFRIRTTKLDRGDQALEQFATIEASYTPVLVDGALQLVRDGDVRIEFSGKQQRGVRAVSLRSFLKKKFDDVFKAELLDKPLRIDEKLPADLKGLKLAEIVVDEGWLQAHLN